MDRQSVALATVLLLLVIEASRTSSTGRSSMTNAFGVVKNITKNNMESSEASRTSSTGRSSMTNAFGVVKNITKNNMESSEIDTALGVKCFRCTVAPPNRYANNTKPQLCSKFDHSDYYTVDCPWSTMCVKRIFKLQLMKAEQETISRDCAQQKNTEQIYKNGNWTKEHHIEEPYEEGCQTIDDSTYCFCRGSLCNSATKVEKNSYHTDAMAVIFVFNVMKYIRNIEY